MGTVDRTETIYLFSIIIIIIARLSERRNKNSDKKKVRKWRRMLIQLNRIFNMELYAANK